jgi:hypothetical protein
MPPETTISERRWFFLKSKQVKVYLAECKYEREKTK